MTIRKVVVPIAALVIGVGASSMAAAQAGERYNNRQGQTSQRSRDDSSARQDNGNRSGRGGGSSDRGDQRAERRGNRDSQSQAQDRPRSQAQAPQPRQEPQPQQRGDDRSNRDRGSWNGGSRRNSDSARGDSRYGRDDNRDSRGSRNSSAYDRGDNRGYSGRSYDRNDYRGSSNDRYRDNSSRGNYGYSRGYNGYSRDYYAPRLLRRGYSQSHYYGSGGRLSLYFGLGSGYRYGSLYSGRVYGYRRGVASYGSYVSYGDIRLKDFPRDGAVYVDGYYAGIVDDFDGFLQRLTLEVGAHEIEVEVRGEESQFFDVYVDPYNTIDLHAERWRR